MGEEPSLAPGSCCLLLLPEPLRDFLQANDVEIDHPVATTQQVADFIQRRVALGRIQPGTNYYFFNFDGLHRAPYERELPSAEAYAEALLEDAEFRALQLDGFLATPTGELLEQTVATVVPSAIAPEFALLVAALKLAAEAQQRRSWGLALVGVGASILVGALISEAVGGATTSPGSGKAT